ncbi:aminodeoxychorismate lyase [Paludibacterium paludis]|uniref:aminodeoxychorismate lyase n=1 Tax=Paludibacterium paludis TaxID=1225769 RepID=A0A918NZU7_9NEIS|nr:aminodeoxychorismate lyase [Paludibacterium paludis]GGY10536.1 aminodeoxychorismate lyase [Paludibacterium paludis]
MLVNGIAQHTIDAGDRGLAYGDGVYRTLECREGQPLLWDLHFSCLARDAASLGLPAPDADILLDEVRAESAGMRRAIAKIILTRGSGRRGYAIPDETVPARLVAAFEWPGYPPEWNRDGITARVCDLRLALQPRLAGIKHLNRLEQVLARSEWRDPSIREGLLLDSEGFVVEGTMSNLVLVRGGELLTPRLDRCGVNGCFLAWLAGVRHVRSERLTLAEVLAADEVWFGNSLAGIWPVAELDGRRWTAFPAAGELASRWAERR